MRLIDADHLTDVINRSHLTQGEKRLFNIKIRHAPTVEPNQCILIVGKRSGKREMLLNALRPQGRWICEDALHCLYYCSNCRNNGERIQPFCAWCGADMRGANNDQRTDRYNKSVN